ncbi:MAG: hypothetical protein ACKUBY_03110 [Candidatus Moraniibacteriota bacterium]|jgi:hypothetical protein
MNNKYIFPLVLLAVGAFIFVAFFTFSPTATDNNNVRVSEDVSTLLQEEQPEPTYLFTHSTGGGIFENIGGDKYILTLSNPESDVIYFSDRPFREVGQEKLGIFLNTLGFEVGDAPNATIVVENEDGDKTMIVAELTEPIFNRDDNTLTYTATILREETGELAEYGEAKIPENFANATLFIDSSKKHTNKKDTWKDHKDEKCGKKDYRMTLGDAYDIASGTESECLIYDDAKLSKTDFECKDDVWKINMDTSLKGEASKCKAYCIVVPNEKYKKGEGVARIEYDCKHSADEKGDKNKYCSSPDVKKGHEYADARSDLISEYHHILNKAKDKKTSYEHHYCVETGMPYSSNKHWATDCSGLGGYALFHKLPYHYKLLDDSRKAHAKADRPLAMDFYNFIDNVNDDGNKEEKSCWERIHKLENAKQGDFLVVKYNEHTKSNSTGHVMWIDEVHSKTGDHRKITVIDSANSGHGSDTRKDKNTYNCKGEHDCGIGMGDMWFYTDDKGHPTQYTWKAHPGQHTRYCKYEDKDCDCSKNGDDKCELEGIVIGRVKNCTAK